MELLKATLGAHFGGEYHFPVEGKEGYYYARLGSGSFLEVYVPSWLRPVRPDMPVEIVAHIQGGWQVLNTDVGRTSGINQDYLLRALYDLLSEAMRSADVKLVQSPNFDLEAEQTDDHQIVLRFTTSQAEVKIP